MAKLPDIENIAGQVGKSPTEQELRGFNLSGCYRVETFTDMAVSEVRMLVPIEFIDGIPLERTFATKLSDGRNARYFSSIMLNFDGQPIRVPFEILADSLHDALTKFAASAQEAGEQTIAQLRERQKATIVGTNGARLN